MLNEIKNLQALKLKLNFSKIYETLINWLIEKHTVEDQTLRSSTKLKVIWAIDAHGKLNGGQVVPQYKSYYDSLTGTLVNDIESMNGEMVHQVLSKIKTGYN